MPEEFSDDEYDDDDEYDNMDGMRSSEIDYFRRISLDHTLARLLLFQTKRSTTSSDR